ncbi:quinate permease protein [Rutstroemia sp. NJR-2017a BBW]|nr:quinate permease protein [Rutstroemia sp. NJR-2017a BBW]
MSSSSSPSSTRPPTPSSPPAPPPPEIFNIRIYLLTLLCCLGSWMFGYNNGVIGGVLVLPAFHSDFKLPATGSSAYDRVTGNIVNWRVGGEYGDVSVDEEEGAQDLFGGGCRGLCGGRGVAGGLVFFFVLGFLGVNRRGEGR